MESGIMTPAELKRISVAIHKRTGLSAIAVPSVTCSVSVKIKEFLLPMTVAQLVEALRYKSEGRGINSRWCNWYFSFT
jgi:hypothetical protein